jgi:trk system potassium uptake protein TrkH
MSWDLKLANSFFLSVCSRTAGFSSLDIMGMQDPSIVIVAILMFIGGGPQGAAGGIKITTMAILLVYLKNVIHPSNKVKIFGETISKNSVAISIRVYFLATTVLAVLFLFLVILNQGENSLHVIFFELIAVFSTSGFSIGLTQTLGELEKVCYVLIMVVGRIGIFTLLIALTGHSGVPRMGEDDGVKIQVG